MYWTESFSSLSKGVQYWNPLEREDLFILVYSLIKKTTWHFTSQNENIYMIRYNSFKKSGANNEFKNY